MFNAIKRFFSGLRAFFSILGKREKAGLALLGATIVATGVLCVVVADWVGLAILSVTAISALLFYSGLGSRLADREEEAFAEQDRVEAELVGEPA